jgi:radical SAM protein with 4Fe4S-binding SPASM domain
MNLTKNLADDFVSLGLQSVLTSLSSFDPQVHDFISGKQGNFKKVVKGIEIAQRSGLSVIVNMVLTKFNEKDVYKTAKFLYNLGVKNFTVTKSSPPLGLNQETYKQFKPTKKALVNALDELVQAKKDFHLGVDILECYPLCFFPNSKKYSIFASHRCMAGISTCTIGANGEVRPCSHADLIYGNIFKESLTNIWGKMEEWRLGQFVPSGCKKCKYLKYCSGGCRMESFYYTGKINGVDPWAKVENQNLLDLDLLIEKDQNENDITLNEKDYLRLNSSLRIRSEDFGIILSTNTNEEYLCSKDTEILINYLKRKKWHQVKNLLRKFRMAERELTFLKKLIKMGIIIQKRGEYNE